MLQTSASMLSLKHRVSWVAVLQIHSVLRRWSESLVRPYSGPAWTGHGVLTSPAPPCAGLTTFIPTKLLEALTATAVTHLASKCLHQLPQLPPSSALGLVLLLGNSYRNGLHSASVGNYTLLNVFP